MKSYPQILGMDLLFVVYVLLIAPAAFVVVPALWISLVVRFLVH